MSKATKKKHVTKEVMDDYVLPEDDQTIVKVFILEQKVAFCRKESCDVHHLVMKYYKIVKYCLYDCRLWEEEETISTKCRLQRVKHSLYQCLQSSGRMSGSKGVIMINFKCHSFSIIMLFIGDFVLVQPITEGEKVKAEILAILYAEQIKYIKSQGKW